MKMTANLNKNIYIAEQAGNWTGPGGYTLCQTFSPLPVRFGLLWLIIYFIANDTLQKKCARARGIPSQGQ